jgi:glutaredoxin
VVLYTTTLCGMRRTFEDCSGVRALLESLGAPFQERDVSMDRGLRDQLWATAGEKVVPPRLFVRGRDLGGAGQVLALHELGRLAPLLPCGEAGARSRCGTCAGVGFVCYTSAAASPRPCPPPPPTPSRAGGGVADHEPDGEAESSAVRRRRQESRLLSRWVARQAKEVLSSMEREVERRNREAELLTLARLHPVSTLDPSSFLLSSTAAPPPPRPQAPSLNVPSSLLQMWCELEHPAPTPPTPSTARTSLQPGPTGTGKGSLLGYEAVKRDWMSSAVWPGSVSASCRAEIAGRSRRGLRAGAGRRGQSTMLS